MKTGMFRALAVTALLASACSSGPPVANAPSPSASASASAPPSPTPTPVRSLAIVMLRGSSSYVVRDLTDINHPRTVSTIGDVPAAQFVSATEISVVAGGLFRVPLSMSNKSLVASQATGGFAWSPDGSAVVYMVQAAEGRA